MSAELIARLWLRMAEIYGHRWTSAHGTDPFRGSGETWARGLAGFGVAEIGRGVEACITGALEWPPTLPEFRALCLDIPPLAIVRVEFAQALRTGGYPSSQFGQLVCDWIDQYAFRNSRLEASERMVSDAYVAARAYRMAGGDLPPPLPAIEPPKPEPVRELTPEEAAARRRRAREEIDRCHELLGLPPRQWAEDAEQPEGRAA